MLGVAFGGPPSTVTTDIAGGTVGELTRWMSSEPTLNAGARHLLVTQLGERGGTRIWEWLEIPAEVALPEEWAMRAAWARVCTCDPTRGEEEVGWTDVTRAVVGWP